MTDHSMYQYIIKTVNPHRPAEVVSLFTRLFVTINQAGMLKNLTLTEYPNNYSELCTRYDEILTALKQLKHWHSYCHKYQIKIQHKLCKVGVTGTWNGKRKSSMPADIQMIETTTRTDHGRRELAV